MREKVWLSVEETAQLLEVSPRTIRRKCQEGDFLVDCRKNEKKRDTYYVSLASLPAPVRRKYRSNQIKKDESLNLAGLKDWQRQHMIKRVNILREWEEYAEQQQTSRHACVDDFVEKVKEKGISRGTIYRWWKARGEKGPVALAPKWNNGREKFSNDTFHPEAKQFFTDIYCHSGQVTIMDAFRKTAQRARGEEWAIPKYWSFREFVRAYIPEDVRIMTREGMKKYTDRVLPYTLRDKSDLLPYQQVLGDHHQMDAACKMPTGDVIFPWLTAFRDAKSGKVTGWSLVSQPSSDTINATLRRMFQRHGIPYSVYLDKGKDFQAKRFVGEKKKEITNCKIDVGLYDALGIEVITARGYNAQEKSEIEQWFRVLEGQFVKYLPGYRGRNTLNRPEKVEKELKEQAVLSFEEMQYALEVYIEQVYNDQTPYEGQGGDGRTPNEIFYAEQTKRMVTEEELSFLCTLLPVTKTVARNGIKHEKEYYWNDELARHYGEKVRIRTIEEDPEAFYVFAMDGTYMCKVEAIERVSRSGEPSKKALREATRRKKVVLETTRGWLRKNIKHPMSPKDRASLTIQTGIDPQDFHEPELEEQSFKSQYLDVVNEIDNKEKEKVKIEASRRAVEFKYAEEKPKPNPRQETAEDRANEFLKKYSTTEVR